jgi:aminoglycoside N3'-acetyltransferase
MLVTQSEIQKTMAEVLELGDDVLVHASLGALGQIEEPVDGIIAAMRAAIGEQGTLIMMADTRSFAKTGRFDMDQPSETGLLTERFRLTPNVVRSCVPMVSFCALGPRAAEYTQPYHSHLDDTATMTRLLRNDGKIMMLGIGYEKCTLYHLAEERLRLPYNMYKDFQGYLMEADKVVGAISQRYFVRREMGFMKNPSIAGSMLEARGGAIIRNLGQSVVRVFPARAFDDCCMEALQRDPEAFVAKSA